MHQPDDSNTVYDPEQMARVNLSDPDELATHMAIRDVRERLRARRRRMMRCFTGFTLLLIVALFAGMYIVGREGKSNAEQQKNFNDHGSASDGSDKVIGAPPADLASKCSLTSLTTRQGVMLCEEACEIAECCDIPEGFALSCLAANPVVCPQYQRYCDILHSIPSSGLDSPPVQAPTGGGSTPTKAPSPAVVDDSALKVKVDQACIGKDAEELDGSTCMGLCQAGFCCFGGSGSCANINCQTYRNCETAFAVWNGDSTPGGSTVTPPPASSPTPMAISDSIDQACGEFVEPINLPGENMCETLCSPSMCCFNHYCLPPDGMDCSDYAGCYTLFTDGETANDDATADEIHTACYNLDINEAAASQECTDFCAPSACCFEPHLQCANVDCATYSECNILYPSHVSVTKDEVTDACSNHRENNLGEATLCEKVCRLDVMQCCFHENNEEGCDSALKTPGSAYCDTYGACDVLGTSATLIRDAHKQELEDACSTTQTRAHCVTLCSAATCCYATTVAEECANVDASITCSDYAACDVLYNR